MSIKLLQTPKKVLGTLFALIPSPNSSSLLSPAGDGPSPCPASRSWGAEARRQSQNHPSLEQKLFLASPSCGSGHTQPRQPQFLSLAGRQEMSSQFVWWIILKQCGLDLVVTSEPRVSPGGRWPPGTSEERFPATWVQMSSCKHLTKTKAQVTTDFLSAHGN